MLITWQSTESPGPALNSICRLGDDLVFQIIMMSCRVVPLALRYSVLSNLSTRNYNDESY
jgi:hypothetical protein